MLRNISDTQNRRLTGNIPWKIFWGLLLSFFNINIIIHLETYFQLAGIILLATAAWQLAGESVRFKRMLIACAAGLILQVACIVISCTPVAANTAYIWGSTLLGSAIMVAVLYFLFTGLRELIIKSPEGERSEDRPEAVITVQQDLTARRIGNCLYIYIAVFLLILLTMAVPAILIMALVVILMIVILVRTYRVISAANASINVFIVRRLDFRYGLVCLASVLVSAAVTVCTLLAVNAPQPGGKPYDLRDTNYPAQAEAMRETLLTKWADKEMVKNLPDSEVLRYQNMRYFDAERQDRQIDGGTLYFTNATAIDDSGNMRILLYYEWGKPPKHTYTDAIYFSFADHRNVLTMLETSQNVAAQGHILSDVDGKTVEATPLVKNLQNTIMQFRLWGSGHERQRGYMAFNAHLTFSDKGHAFNIAMWYVHQNSLWNTPYQNGAELIQNTEPKNLMDLTGTSGSNLTPWSSPFQADQLLADKDF